MAKYKADRSKYAADLRKYNAERDRVVDEILTSTGAGGPAGK